MIELIFLTLEDKIQEVQNLVMKMAELKNKLKDIGVIRSEETITTDYAEWFCLKKFDLELCDKKELGYDAISKFGDKYQIRSRIGSDIDFNVTFDMIRFGEVDFLLLVFINDKSWMIDSIYRVSSEVVKVLVSAHSTQKFEWTRRSRSLSLQVYPDSENTLPMI